MFLLHLTTLAQAKPPEEVTPGALISGMLVLAVMAASLGMIVAWTARIRETGHALPAAQRGILRVPPVLTFIAIGLSLLMILMMGLVAVEDNLIPPVAVAPKGAAMDAGSESTPNSSEVVQTKDTAEDSASADVADGATSSSAEAGLPEDDNTSPPENAAAQPSVEAGEGDADSAIRGLTPEDMQRALVQTVIMDVFFFIVLGSVVFVASSHGRVMLATAVHGAATGAVQAVQHTRTYVSNSLWPDLDEDPSSTPPLETLSPVYVSPSTTLAPPGASDSPYAPPRESFMPVSDEPGLLNLSPSDEPFSWTTELRFAGEVFLAAYVPTAVLRIFIVLLTVGILGKEPEQHPFLEMMDSGVGSVVLMLILLTAVFLAPLVEELQFRVVMLGGIAQLGHPILGLVVSSMLFAFAHGFPDSLALVPLAFALGYTYLRRRSYITVMMVHFLFNGFNMVLALMAML